MKFYIFTSSSQASTIDINNFQCASQSSLSHPHHSYKTHPRKPGIHPHTRPPTDPLIPHPLNSVMETLIRDIINVQVYTINDAERINRCSCLVGCTETPYIGALVIPSCNCIQSSGSRLIVSIYVLLDATDDTIYHFLLITCHTGSQ